MKLRNKKTGEIVEAHDIDLIGNVYLKIFRAGDYDTKKYNSLAEFNAEWEDYEEPKVYWFLSGRGEIRCIEDDNTEFDKDHKLIGNYFETKEEAEKAVEKLNAWKRLKDKEFKFKDWEVKNGCKIFFGLDDKSFNAGWLDENIVKDLDLLFGVEE